ncbi:GntR family transcriptional regulator [bacterium AH-315-E10]|nr:GntR family transcriptional regulator [bacterium AH-315-E10]
MHTDIHQIDDERKYVQVADDLARRIQNREFRGRLPAIRRLAQAYDVDPRTISRAYDVLNVQKLIIRENRRGIFVRSLKNCDFRHCVYLVNTNRIVTGDPVLAALIHKCAALEWDLSVLSHNDDAAQAESIVHDLIQRRIPCGIIVQPLSSMSHAGIIQQLGDSSIPSVWLQAMPDEKVRTVSDDEGRLVHELINQLIAEGHSEIACVLPSDPSPQLSLLCDERLMGYCHAMENSSLALHVIQLSVGDTKASEQMRELTACIVFDAHSALRLSRIAATSMRIIAYGTMPDLTALNVTCVSPSYSELVDAAVESLVSTSSMNYTVRITSPIRI